MPGKSIGETAALTGVPAWRLRAWEASGHLHPRRSANGYRLYGDADLAQIRALVGTDDDPRRPSSVRSIETSGHSRADVARRHVSDLLDEAWRFLAVATRENDSYASDIGAGLDAMLLVCDASVGAIAIADPIDHEFTVVAQRGLSDRYLDGIANWRLHEGLAGRALAAREPLAVSDLCEHPGAARTHTLKEQLRGYLCVPIVRGTRRLGIVEVYAHEPRDFMAAEIDAVEQLSTLVAALIEASHATEQLEELRAQRSRFSRQWTAQWSLATQAERERIASLLDVIIEQPGGADAGNEQFLALVRGTAHSIRAAERALVDSRRLLLEQVATALGSEADIKFFDWPELLPIEFATRFALAIGRLTARIRDLASADIELGASRQDDDLVIEFVLASDAATSHSTIGAIDAETMTPLEELGGRLGTRIAGSNEIIHAAVAIPSAVPIVDRLTERERQVLDELAGAQSNSELAAQFGISVKTLQNHLTSIYRKLGVANRVEAVSLVAEKHPYPGK